MAVAWGIAGMSGRGGTKTLSRGKIIGKGSCGRAGVHPCPQITFDVGTAAASALVGAASIPSPCPSCREGEGMCWELPPCSPRDQRLPGERLTC